MKNTFYIDKLTGTFADELLAAGLVRLLEQLLHQQGQQTGMTQTDFGHYYQIETAVPLNLEKVQANTTPFVLAPVIRTVKNSKKLPDLPDNPRYVINYDHERDQRGAFLTAFKDLEKTAKRAYIVGDDDNFPFDHMPPSPHQHWHTFRLLNPAALIGYNNLMTQWFKIGRAGQIGAVCHLLCQLFSETPNDVETAVQKIWKPFSKPYKWKTDATASQFFNPSQGKGINKPQPNGVGLGNMRNFWLLEWLKVVGFYEIALTRTLQGVKDRKTYVPAMGRANVVTRQQIQRQFEKRMRFAETAVRSDILTVIRYMTAFMERIEAAQQETASAQEQALLAMMGEVKRPSQFIRGFHTVTYKDLGNAVTTMNISFLNLPGWVIITNHDDVAAYQKIFAEHENIVRQFAENKGEELELLTRYRDFIVADHLDPFFKFTTAYSSWIISQGGKSKFPPRQFTTKNLRRMIVNNQNNLRHILDLPGFINIARAIRESTVRAQYRKNKKNDKRYTVRYGLGRDLVRQSQYPAEFIAALSEFILHYNAENAQVLERYPEERYPQYKHRWDVQTRDVDEIVALIDNHGSNLIAKLLVAYGYASEYRAIQENNQQSTVTKS